MTKKTKAPKYTELLRTIAVILESPRDRLGRLEPYDDASRNACEQLRLWSVDLCATPSIDRLEQIAKLIRITLQERGK